MWGSHLFFILPSEDYLSYPPFERMRILLMIYKCTRGRDKHCERTIAWLWTFIVHACIPIVKALTSIVRNLHFERHLNGNIAICVIS